MASHSGRRGDLEPIVETIAENAVVLRISFEMEKMWRKDVIAVDIAKIL